MHHGVLRWPLPTSLLCRAQEHDIHACYRTDLIHVKYKCICTGFFSPISLGVHLLQWLRRRMHHRGNCGARAGLSALSEGVEVKANVFLVHKCEYINKFVAIKRMTAKYTCWVSQTASLCFHVTLIFRFLATEKLH